MKKGDSIVLSTYIPKIVARAIAKEAKENFKSPTRVASEILIAWFKEKKRIMNEPKES